MIKSIDEASCTNCGLCENICPVDVFRSKRGKVYIAYQNDCNSCLQCQYVCPVDALTITAGVPKKYDMTRSWLRIKEMMGAA